MQTLAQLLPITEMGYFLRIMATLTIEYDLTDQQFFSVVDLAGYGIAYWAASAEVDAINLTYTITDAENEVFTVSKQSIERALADIARGSVSVSSDIKRAALHSIISGDTGELDSAAADVIIQVAIYGEIIYG